MAERTQPNAPEAEVAVLGAMLIDPDAVNAAVAELSDRDFYAEKNRRVYRAMLRLFDAGTPVEPVTLREELSNAGQLDAVGGVAYLSELMDAVVTAANVTYHIGILKDRSTRRALIAAGTEIARIGHGDGEARSLVAKAQELVYAVGEGTVRGGFQALKKLLFPAFALIEQASKGDGSALGIPTGLRDVDAMIGGLRDGSLTVLAARPSMGKTALGMNIVANVAIQQQRPVGVFSMEMSKQEIVERLLAAEAMVDLSRMTQGKLLDDDYVRLAQAAGHLDQAPIWIDDAAGLTAVEIRAKARLLKAECPELALILVDYLTLMNGGEGDNMHQTVGSNAKAMKEMAKELGVPVILLAQLSRKPEDRSDKRPIVSDLRESGNIEEHADNIWLLYRPEVYFGVVGKEGESLEGKAELIIGKQRNGPTGVVELYFRKASVRYEDTASWGARAA